VLGQQVSLAAARTFAGRIAARYGGRVPAAAGEVAEDGATAGDGVTDGAPAAAPGAPALLFPQAADLAGADLSGLGLTTARQATLRALATAVAGGGLALDQGADPEETAARLAELPGVGPWTAAYILMRAVGDPDAYPASDLGLRRALERLGGDAAQARRWRPWRAYAAVHLWAWEAGHHAANRHREQATAQGTS
jgi:AraC family transcriptional regulator of adaptative response / DNA-3-methyladenine glycosylase II